MGSSLSKRRERDEDHDNHDEEGAETRLVLKKARFESWGDTDVVVIVGHKEFPECSRFLRCWSGYFEDELNKTPSKTTFEFPDKVPEEWELLKNVLHPFAAESIQTTNYHVLLPWFATLRCEAGLGETDTCILTKIIDPLLQKPEKERTAADVGEIVTVLEHCVTWSRTGPRDSCITFLRQIFKDPGQPFEGKDLLRIVLLLTKDDACQKALWKFVKYYLPAELVESSSFPADKVKLVADNPLLLDVIEANMKLKKCLYVVELKLKQVVATQNTSNSNSTPTMNENTAVASKEDEKEKAVDPETEKPKKKKTDAEPEKKQQRRVNPYKKQPKDAPESHKKTKTPSATAMEKAKSAMEKAKNSVEKAKSALEDKVEKTRKVLEKKSSGSSKNSSKNKDGSGSDSEKSVAENEEPDCVVLVEV